MKTSPDEFATDQTDQPTEEFDEPDGLPVIVTVPRHMRPDLNKRLLAHEGGTGGRAGSPRMLDSEEY